MAYDFSGYATKSGIRCSDGRVISPDAFREMNGKTVPLVWQHDHENVGNVLGHAVLENRSDGVYARCSLNDSEAGKQTKTLIEHGDINSLSIYANKLSHKGSQVTHGVIREVSVVLAGANPGALIDNVSIQHSDGSEDISEEEAFIYSGEEVAHPYSEEAEASVEHSIKEYKTGTPPPPIKDEKSSTKDKEPSKMAEEKELSYDPEEVFDSFTKHQKDVINAVISINVDKELGNINDKDLKDLEEVQHADEETVQDVFDDMTPEQQEVAYYLIAKGVEDSLAEAKKENQNGSKAQQDTEEKEGSEMKHNIFENDHEGDTMISTEDRNELFHDAIANKGQYGSLKKSLEHAAGDYGIGDIDLLFPDAKAEVSAPTLMSEKLDWVETFVSALHPTPFSRIKSFVADITGEEARAKGYIKGSEKLEEFFSVAKRATGPQTIYKKQKLDRDDILDITDYDVVAWLKSEMMTMLKAEIGRSVLIGDGRSEASPDKIKEGNIRPIWTDDELYTIHQTVPNEALTDETQSDLLVDSVVRALDDYQGKGTPNLYASPRTITNMLLTKDKFGRRVYSSLSELADALSVANVIRVPFMKGATRTAADVKLTLAAIVVNPNDYTIGTNKGGELSFFNDFDIDFNQEKYLYETRLSGALTIPKTAVAIEALPAVDPAPEG